MTLATVATTLPLGSLRIFKLDGKAKGIMVMPYIVGALYILHCIQSKKRLSCAIWFTVYPTLLLVGTFLQLSDIAECHATFAKEQ